MDRHPPLPRWAVALYALMLLGLAAHAVHAVLPVADSRLIDSWLYSAVDLLAVAGCAAGALRLGARRRGWLVLTAALGFWTAGDISFNFLLTDPVASPTFADGLYLVYYPLILVGLLLVARDYGVRGRRIAWLDGVIAGAAMSSLAAAELHPALQQGGEKLLAAVTNSLYIGGDLVLMAVSVGILVSYAGRRERGWWTLGAALVLCSIADAAYLSQAAAGTYHRGSLVDTGYLASAVLLAALPWLWSVQERAPDAASRTGWQARGVPMACAGLATATLVAVPGDGVTRVLAGLSLLAVFARLVLTGRETTRLLEASEYQALTDELTGLGNRRALLADLAALSPSTPSVLVLFDLDGFKRYNDTFGHPVGDALLHRLGRRLQAVGGGSRAYRLGGDEFCILGPADDGPERLLDRGRDALSERGESFEITSSAGHVLMPAEATGPSEALTIADRRMYAAKQRLGGRDDPHTRAALLRTVRERRPELARHHEAVAELAARMGRALGLDPEEQDVLTRAAELHDIGKIAVPDQILEGAGPLSEAEWEFMRRHTLIGERIIACAPPLVRVAAVVRSTHERWDGNGYPDRLAGFDIDRAARIIAICDAYDVITSVRPYHAAEPPQVALAELHRCAGTQFDPVLVELFARVHDRRHAGALA